MAAAKILPERKANAQFTTSTSHATCRAHAFRPRPADPFTGNCAFAAIAGKRFIGRRVNLEDRHRRSETRSGSALERFLRLIRFSHTIFALPFALGALVVAANGLPSARTLLLILVCMVSARTSAMLFNRFFDWSLDQRNPQTASRHLLLSNPAIAPLPVLISARVLAAAAGINRLTFVLSPIALAIVFFYSLSK